VAHPGVEPDVEDLRSHVRSQLRGSRTPDRVVFRDELPTNATGKVLRRELVNELNQDPSPAQPAAKQGAPT
jgi:acyl-CoA synthetase (AMP-forming)/AMP-acid ligase II